MKVVALLVVLSMALASEANPQWPWAPAPHWAPAPWAAAPWPAAWPWGWPAEAPAPAPTLAIDAPAVPVPAATSVTANRGAVHVAPLPGHSVNQQQLNLAAADGTA